MDSVHKDNSLPGGVPDYTAVVQHLAALDMARGGSVWPRSSTVRPDHIGYYIPETNLYRGILKQDRRSGKELEYIHSSGTWLERGLAALELWQSPAKLGLGEKSSIRICRHRCSCVPSQDPAIRCSRITSTAAYYWAYYSRIQIEPGGQSFRKRGTGGRFQEWDIPENSVGKESEQTWGQGTICLR